jgi:hypothetical protein
MFKSLHSTKEIILSGPSWSWQKMTSIMHPALVLLGLWAIAFITLALALLAMNAYSDYIGYDFALKSVGKEGVLAAVCSAIQAGSVWTVVTYFPGAGRALFIPVLLIVLLYVATHLEDWNKIDAVIVLVFQGVIAATFTFLFKGEFGSAIGLVAIVAGALAILANITKDS